MLVRYFVSGKTSSTCYRVKMVGIHICTHMLEACRTMYPIILYTCNGICLCIGIYPLHPLSCTPSLAQFCFIILMSYTILNGPQNKMQYLFEWFIFFNDHKIRCSLMLTMTCQISLLNSREPSSFLKDHCMLVLGCSFSLEEDDAYFFSYPFDKTATCQEKSMFCTRVFFCS